MKIKKGQLLFVRAGIGKSDYKAIAESDFDTETDDWYPVILDQSQLDGLSKSWRKGDVIPCRRGSDAIELRE